MEDSKRISITGKAIVVSGNDIDTDRIIPARFLRCVTFDGLGEHAFEDDRKQLAEAGKTHPLDDPTRAGAEVLLVNRNFGCGSSREHAPQALMRWGRGIKAIVGESFAEIFFGNCVSLGIPCITASTTDVRALQEAAAKAPDMPVTVDVATGKITLCDLTVQGEMPTGPRAQLTTGRWDSTTELLEGTAQLQKTASALPYFTW